MFAGAQVSSGPPPPPQPNPWLPVQQPIWNGSTGIDTSVTVDGGTMTEDQLTEFLDDQTALQGWGMGANALGAVFNTVASITGMVLNRQVVGEYSDYMNKVADNGMTVASKQLDVQKYAIDNALIMQERQQGFGTEMAKIEQAKEIQLARIAERGKTDRAALYTANNAFGMRSAYPNGSPLFSTF